MGFAGDRLGKESLASARWADEQDAFGNSGADRFVAVRVLKKVDDFLKLILGFLATGDVVKSDTGLLFRDEAGLTFAEAQDGFARATEAASNKGPNQDHNPQRHDPGEKELREETRAFAAETDIRSLKFSN